MRRRIARRKHRAMLEETMRLRYAELNEAVAPAIVKRMRQSVQ